MIYDTANRFFKEKLRITEDIEILYVFVGARGKISKFFVVFAKKFKISMDLLKFIEQESLKDSIKMCDMHYP